MKTAAQPQQIDAGGEGLNDILSSGLPAGQMYLPEGRPGIRMSIMAGESAVHIVKLNSLRRF